MGEERRDDNPGKRILPTTRPPSYDAITPTSSRLAPPISRGATDPHMAFTPTSFVSEKSLLTAYLLCFPLGFLGLHHFYLGRPAFGVLYVLTLGVGGLGWLVDFFRMPYLVREANWRLSHPAGLQMVSVIDAYLMWFPFGIFGLHQLYLGRRIWGLTYTFTLGMFGVGWIIDGFRIPFLVHDIKSRRLELEREPLMRVTPQPLNLWDLYTLCLSPPFGIFGAHHFHMGRTLCGLYYLFSFGGCGVGWVVDWFRLKCLVDRVNYPERYPLGRRQKFVDDAYIFAFPLGLLGTHHFYLGRPGWGVLYFFTGGLLGIGWLVDLCRMPRLVADANRRLQNEQAHHAAVAPNVVMPGLPYTNTSQGLYFYAVPATGTFQTPVMVGGVYETQPVHLWGGQTSTLQPPSYETLPSASNGDSWVSVSTPGPEGSSVGPPAYEPYNQKRTN